MTNIFQFFSLISNRSIARLCDILYSDRQSTIASQFYEDLEKGTIKALSPTDYKQENKRSRPIRMQNGKSNIGSHKDLELEPE